MGENGKAAWMVAVKPATSGPLAKPPRDGDKLQARQRINVEVRTGRRPSPNSFPCADCGHFGDDRRHEYHHYRGYAAENHSDVMPLCTACHSRRDNPPATHCKHGHEFTEKNTIIKTNGMRQCRECRRSYDRRRKRPLGFWKSINERRRDRVNQQRRDKYRKRVDNG